MQLDWENPFGNRSAQSNWGMPIHTAKTESGVYVPRPTYVDIEKIQREQRKLYPYFEAIYDAASEVLESGGLTLKKLSQRPIITSFTYRVPDNPLLLNEFHHELTSNTVTLSETGEKSHPIVEYLFPVRPFKTLSPEIQSDVRAAAHIALGCRVLKESDVPTHVRVVLPETIHFIMHWLTSLDGPITNFTYRMRPVGKDTILGNVESYELGPKKSTLSIEDNARRDGTPFGLH